MAHRLSHSDSLGNLTISRTASKTLLRVYEPNRKARNHAGVAGQTAMANAFIRRDDDSDHFSVRREVLRCQ